MSAYRSYIKNLKAANSLKSSIASSRGSFNGRERSLGVPRAAEDSGFNPESALAPLTFDEDEADVGVVEEKDSEAESDTELVKSFVPRRSVKVPTQGSINGTKLTDLLERLEADGEVRTIESSRTFRVFEDKLGKTEPDMVFVSKNNLIPPSLRRATGRSYGRTPTQQTGEYVYIEKSGQPHTKNYSTSFKVIQRKFQGANLNASEVRPARRIIAPDPPDLEPAEDMPKHTLYGEVTSTSYSMGGDGFVLHAGDIVMIVNFLQEYGLAEVRWQGLQGLFSIEKLKVMLPRPSKDSSTTVLQFANREISKTFREFNVMKRQQKRHNTQTSFAK